VRGNTQLLSRGESILDTYTVEFFLGQGAFGEVYRVRHRFLGTQVMKVFKAEVSEMTDLETLAGEARILSSLTHPNIVRVFEANTLKKGENSHIFLTMGFVMGESLAQLLDRKVVLPFPIATSIQLDLLEGLAVAHSQQPQVVHRDISPDNVMLSYADDKPTALLSDFGLALQADLNESFLRPAGKYLFMAPECFFRTYLPCSDVFSAAIVFYRMITGTLPWELDVSAQFGNSSALVTGVHKARKAPPLKPSLLCESCTPAIEAVIMKALTLDIEGRYRDATQFLSELKAALAQPFPSLPTPESVDKKPIDLPLGDPVDTSDRRYKVRRAGKGFDEIAGMHALKEMLYHDVILPLQDKELYEQYQVSIPNGLLLYGPPGCGKTFIAQKFAKEVGYTYIELKPSDIASIYVHGTQEKIREVFTKAEQDAPTLLFIDEVDAVMPNREDNLGHSYASEVNEFLVQMT
jgi:transitional endoplasmic reticulum ATPase